MGRLIEETLRDVAYAWRGLRKAPGFTAAALATLALGVAANTAIFSVANALLVEPLPFRDPERLVFVWADQTDEGYPRAPLSGPELQDLDDRSSQFDGFGAIWATTAALTGENDPEQLRIGLVTTDYFSLLGAEAALGRTFQTDDDAVAAPTTILLSAAVWRRRYGSDPGIVGRRIDVNGRPTIVVGVMPDGFRLLMPPDAAVPDDLEAWQPLNRRFPEGPRGQRYLRVIGRMRPGVGVADAQADIARVGREISAAHAFYGAAGRQFETVPLHVDATRDVRRPLVALSIGVAILLLIACVNVGSLLVARAAARSRETAVKAALGATVGRLMRQHVVESLVLGVLGAGLGLLLGRWGLTALLSATPDALSRLRLASVDTPVAVVCTLTVLLWTVLLSAAPVAEARRVGVARALQHDARRAGGGRHRLRAALTVAQIALSVVLVVGALLLVRTVQQIQQVDPGFRADGVLSFRVALPGSRYGNQDAFNAFSRQLQTALAALPGATAASAVSHAPYDHVPNWGGPFLAVEGADAVHRAASRLPRGRARPDGAARRATRRGSLLHRERRPPRRAGHDRRRAPGAAHVAGRVGARPSPRRGSVGRRHAGHLDHRRRRRAARAASQSDRGGARPGLLPRAPDPEKPGGLPDQDRRRPSRADRACPRPGALARPGLADLRRAAPGRPTSPMRGPCGSSPPCSRCSSPWRRWHWPASASTGSSPTRSPSGIASSECGWRWARGGPRCSVW